MIVRINKNIITFGNVSLANLLFREPLKGLHIHKILIFKETKIKSRDIRKKLVFPSCH